MIITAGIPRKPGMSRDDLIATNAGVIKTVAEQRQDALPRRLRDRHHQPARRDGLGDAEGQRPAGQHGGRHGGRPGFRPLPLFPGGGVRGLGRGRHGVRARRPRRQHGAARALLDGRRHPAARPGQDGLDHARSGSTRSSSGPATAAARSSSCSSPARRSTRLPRPRSRWPKPICSIKSACCLAPLR